MSEFIVFDTTTEYGSLAFFKDRETIFYIEVMLKKSFSELLTPVLELMKKTEIIDLEDIDFIGVVIGPGSFTGTRIGLSTAKGIAEGLDIPIVPITTFSALYKKVSREKNVIPFIDARKKQVFSEIRVGGKLILPPGSYFPEIVMEKAPKDSLFIGNGALLYKEKILDSGNRVYENSLFLSKEAGAIALEMYKNGKYFKPYRLKPIYLRRSDAELNRRK